MNSSSPIVLFDACVLYPAPVRDFLLQLSVTGLFRARWTKDIHNEWIANLLESRPDLNLKQLERTRDLMNLAVPDSLVTGYESHIPSLDLPDPDDRHVLAAAIEGNAETIVTFNLKDFPPASLHPFGLSAVHPDSFVLSFFNQSPISVSDSAKMVRNRLRNPTMSLDDYFERLSGSGFVETVAGLRAFESGS
ncbi:MAG: PIN domain-containing protein [Candidatus Omnitrophica bacterium]|nr:PIN domain-containing protein [Candidatus Omnitrophota bacterium]